MRICSPQLGIAPDANLGGAVYDRELLAALAALGAEISILLPRDEPAGAVAGWEITRTARHRRSYYEYNWIFHRSLAVEYERRRFDVLRVHSPYSIGPGALAFAARVRVPAVLHYLHVEPRPLWRFVDRLTLGRYAHVVTISEATRGALLERYPLAPERVTVARPGINPFYSPGERDAVLRANWGGALVALHVGSVIARKNLIAVVHAVHLLAQEGLDVRLVIAGTGAAEPDLRREAARLGVEKAIEFRGRVTEPQKLALLRSADLFVFPSKLEGFGMAAAEAMACGLPVLAYGSGPTLEFITHEVSGWLVDPAGGARGLAAGIRHLAGQPALREALGRTGRTRAVGMTWEASARRVLAVYEEVASRARP